MAFKIFRWIYKCDKFTKLKFGKSFYFIFACFTSIRFLLNLPQLHNLAMDLILS